MRVLAFDPVADDDFDARHGLGRHALEDLLAASDVVSLHLPLLPETRGLINRRTLALMRPGSYLINTSRGGLVVEADLAESLASGHLAAAGVRRQRRAGLRLALVTGHMRPRGSRPPTARVRLNHPGAGLELERKSQEF